MRKIKDSAVTLFNWYWDFLLELRAKASIYWGVPFFVCIYIIVNFLVDQSIIGWFLVVSYTWTAWQIFSRKGKGRPLQDGPHSVPNFLDFGLTLALTVYFLFEFLNAVIHSIQGETLVVVDRLGDMFVTITLIVMFCVRGDKRSKKPFEAKVKLPAWIKKYMANVDGKPAVLKS